MPDQGKHTSQFYVSIEGMDDSTLVTLMGDLLEATVESSLHLPDVATVVLHDTHLKWVDDSRIQPGRELKISAKPRQASDAGASGGGDAPLFDGEIVELESAFAPAAHKLTIRAFDRLHRLSRGSNVRSFVNVTVGDIASKIAQERGLHADIAATPQVHPYLFQHNQTDLEFLQSRANALGYVVNVDGKTLRLAQPAADSDNVALQWNKDLLEFNPRMTTVGQITGSTVRGWDPSARQEIVGQAQQGNGIPKVGEQSQPGQLAQQAFNVEAKLLTVHRPIRTQAEADQLAQAVADRQSSRFIEADGVCIGNGKILAGSPVEITAIGNRFSGTYVVTSATHTYNASEGYKTHFSISGQNPVSLLSLISGDSHGGGGGSAAGAGGGGSTGSGGGGGGAVKGLAIGVVTDNNDPDGQGRVKVKFPALSSDDASDWARVVVPGGGDARGMQFLPEINDEVLVGFEMGDIHYPYVLGGLWNGQDAPALSDAVSGGKVQKRVIQSRSGHNVLLDDTDGAGGITITDRSGNQIQLDTGSNALNVKTQGDVTIEAQGNMTLRAQGQVEIDGMGITVNGGAGTVDVKGSLINLN
jgi:phage protein D